MGIVNSFYESVVPLVSGEYAGLKLLEIRKQKADYQLMIFLVSMGIAGYLALLNMLEPLGLTKGKAPK
ncbi:hypothetical protein NS383_18905 [Pseudomonas oryzihabitans]|nr:hypothetical protein NS383_18905 [Pseudomonas psychrotolerans]